MTGIIYKFPYNVSRRVHSRKPRRSKNGTPEGRAAKAGAAAAELTSATVTEIPVRSSDNQDFEFLQKLRVYFVQEFARGRDVDQIFDDLEGSYRQVDKALRKP